VLVADGHALKRAGMMYAVQQHSTLEVAGEAIDRATACQFVAEQQPDLVVFNLALPGDGLALLLAGKPLHPRARWIAVSPTRDVLTLQRALQAGASGCVLEEEGMGELLAALREVVEGRTFLSRKISALLLASAARKAAARWEALLPTLSDREWQVFRHLGTGQGPAAMARELGLSPKTIETHEQRIQEKLHLTGASQLRAAAEAWAAGVSEPAEAEGRMLYDSEPADEEWMTPWEEERSVLCASGAG
jgi:DNA-binding NarL/FixJ family response regulator